MVIGAFKPQMTGLPLFKEHSLVLNLVWDLSETVQWVSAQKLGDDSKIILLFMVLWRSKKSNLPSFGVCSSPCPPFSILCSRWVSGGAPAALPPRVSRPAQPPGAGTRPAAAWSGDSHGETGPHLGPQLCLGHLLGHDGETWGILLINCASIHNMWWCWSLSEDLALLWNVLNYLHPSRPQWSQSLLSWTSKPSSLIPMTFSMCVKTLTFCNISNGGTVFPSQVKTPAVYIVVDWDLIFWVILDSTSICAAYSSPWTTTQIYPCTDDSWCFLMKMLTCYLA